MAKIELNWLIAKDPKISKHEPKTKKSEILFEKSRLNLYQFELRRGRDPAQGTNLPI